MSRLINKDTNTAPKDSPIPPPGPFVVPQPNGHFTEIQPPFVNLILKNQKAEEEKLADEKTNGTAEKEESKDEEMKGALFSFIN